MQRFSWLYRLADVLALWLAVIFAFQLRFTSGLIPVFKSFQDLELYLKTLAIATPLYLLLFAVMGNYKQAFRKLGQYEAQNILRTIAMFYLFFLAVSLLIQNLEWSRIIIGLSFFLNILLCLFFRRILSAMQVARWKKGKERIRFCLLAYSPKLLEDVSLALQDPKNGYELVGAVVINGQSPLPRLPFAEIDRILIAGGDLPFAHIADLVVEAPPNMPIDFIPTYHLLLNNIPAKEYIGIYPVIPINQPLLSDWNSFAKRVMDITISTIVLILFAPFLLFIPLAIWISYGRPILFKQKRVGHNGRVFTLYKFRTMKQGSERYGNQLIAEQKQPIFKWKGDPRVENRFAWFLRRTGLDELPQLWNVLEGSMSLVGPRPVTLDLLRNQSAEEKLRLSVPPGITGLQQVNCRGTTSIDDLLKYDLHYIARRNLWLDIVILMKTIRTLITGRGTP